MNKGCTTALIIFGILLIILVAGTGFYLYQKGEEPPVTYKTETPKVNDIILKSVATGSVVPRKEILIKPQVSGIISELYLEAGEIVKNGDLIAKVKVIPDMISLNNADNRVKRGKIALDNAIRDYDRNKELVAQGVISAVDFQAFEIAKRNAEQEYNAALDNQDIVREGAAKRSGGAGNTLIRSTIDGMVLDIPVEVGNSVIEANNFNEGTTIAEIANMDDLIFEGKIDESEVEKLRNNMDLILTIGAIEDREFEATLEFISPKGVEENGAVQFDIKAAVAIPEDQFIRAGYSANANIVLDRRDGVLTISEGLVQYDKDLNTFVEVMVAENEYEKRPVELGLSDGIIVEVLSGVSETDEIKVWNQPITE